jgi:hypothetical protein
VINDGRKTKWGIKTSAQQEGGQKQPLFLMKTTVYPIQNSDSNTV